jgi:hypothetical protein
MLYRFTQKATDQVYLRLLTNRTRMAEDRIKNRHTLDALQISTECGIQTYARHIRRWK